MTEFDGGVPADAHDQHGPKHDSKTPATEDAPDPDEPQIMSGDGDLISGHYGPTTDNGDG